MGTTPTYVVSQQLWQVAESKAHLGMTADDYAGSCGSILPSWDRVEEEEGKLTSEKREEGSKSV